MNTSQLGYFSLALEELSFTAAARRVPMSAQGLAKSIHSLEAELGVPLFEASDETPGRLSPTPYAEELGEYCREVLAARKRLDDGIARISRSASQTVRLAVAIGALSMLGMDLVPEFRRANPGVDVVCDDLPDIAADEAVLSGDCPLGLTVLPAPEGMEAAPLARCDRYVWVRASDPLARRRSVGLRDLAGRRVALVGPQFKQYALLRQRLDEEGVRVQDLVTSSEMIWLHQFAKDGEGVAFTARSVLPLFADDRSVVALPFTGMPYEVCVSWKAGHVLAPAEERLARLCRERAAASEFGVGKEGALPAPGGRSPAGALRSLFHRGR